MVSAHSFTADYEASREIVLQETLHPQAISRHRLGVDQGDPSDFRTTPGCPLTICGRPLSGKGKRWGRCCAWSGAVICPAFDAARRRPPACMGVRGPGPDHPQRA